MSDKYFSEEEIKSALDNLGKPSEHPVVLLMDDMLLEETKKTRNYILISSLIAIAVVSVGIIPSKISALGIEFKDVNQKAFIELLIFINVYFLLAYSIRIWADFISWTIKVKVAEDNLYWKNWLLYTLKEKTNADESKKFTYTIAPVGGFFFHQIKPASIFKAILMFFVPIPINIYALFLLFKSIGIIS